MSQRLLPNLPRQMHRVWPTEHGLNRALVAQDDRMVQRLEEEQEALRCDVVDAWAHTRGRSPNSRRREFRRRMPSAQRSPTLFTRFGTLSIVNSRGSRSSVSSRHRSGVETLADGSARAE